MRMICACFPYMRPYMCHYMCMHMQCMSSIICTVSPPKNSNLEQSLEVGGTRLHLHKLLLHLHKLLLLAARLLFRTRLTLLRLL